MALDPKAVEAEALKEFHKELFEEAVLDRKAALRARYNRPWWRNIFPYRIKLVPID